MTDAVTNWKPDLVIREPCEYASAALAAQYGIATAQVAISPAGSEHGSIRAAAPALEELHPGLPEQLMAGAYLTRFRASLDPSPFPTTIRYRAPTQPPVALPDWWSGSDRPLVYVSFGSVFGHLSGAVAAYRAVLSAVAPLPVRMLLTTGRHHVDAAALGPQPRNVHVQAWVEQADALAQADLLVCHGGSGTVLGALEAGMPLVVVPAYGDQVTNARHIANAGAGLAVEIESRHEHGRLVSDRDAPRITAAVQTLLSDSSFRSAARAISAEIAATPLIDDTLADLAAGLT